VPETCVDRQRPSLTFAYPLVCQPNCLIPLLFRPVSAISEVCGTLTEGLNIASHAPSIDLISIINRPIAGVDWLGRMTGEHFELATVVN